MFLRCFKMGKGQFGDLNPSKRPEVRKKISEKMQKLYKEGKTKSWNKGKCWSRKYPHDRYCKELAQLYETKGYKIINTEGYVPDLILIDFENKKVVAIEVNAGSEIDKQKRADKRNYDEVEFWRIG